MEAAVLQKWAGLEKWLRSSKQPVCGLACHVHSQPQKAVIEVLGLGKKEVEGSRLGDLFCPDFRELPAFSDCANLPGRAGFVSALEGRSFPLQTELQFKGSPAAQAAHRRKNNLPCPE